MDRFEETAEDVRRGYTTPLPNAVADRATADQKLIVTRRQNVSAASVLAALAGGVLVVAGAVGLIRGDLSGSWRDPIVQVAGWSHMPLLSAIELVAGAFLLFAGFTRAKSSIIGVGSLIVLAAIIGFIQPTALGGDFRLSRGYLLAVFLLGAIPALGALLIADVSRNTQHQSTSRTLRN